MPKPSTTNAAYNGAQGGKHAAGPASSTPQKAEATALSAFGLRSSNSEKKGKTGGVAGEATIEVRPDGNTK